MAVSEALNRTSPVLVADLRRILVDLDPADDARTILVFSTGEMVFDIGMVDLEYDSEYKRFMLTLHKGQV